MKRLWKLEPLQGRYQGTVAIGPNNERITFWSEDHSTPMLSPRERVRYEGRRTEVEIEVRTGLRNGAGEYTLDDHTKSGLYENRVDYEQAVEFCAAQNRLLRRAA